MHILFLGWGWGGAFEIFHEDVMPIFRKRKEADKTTHLDGALPNIQKVQPQEVGLTL